MEFGEDDDISAYAGGGQDSNSDSSEPSSSDSDDSGNPIASMAKYVNSQRRELEQGNQPKSGQLEPKTIELDEVKIEPEEKEKTPMGVERKLRKMKRMILDLRYVLDNVFTHLMPPETVSRNTGAEGSVRFKVLVRLLIIGAALVQITFVTVTIIRLLFPSFNFPTAIAFVIPIWIASEIVWMVRVIFFKGPDDGIFKRVLRWILGVAVFAAYFVMIFILSTGIRWSTGFVIHGVVIVWQIVFWVATYVARSKQEILRRFGVRLMGTVMILLILTVMFWAATMVSEPGIFFYYMVLILASSSLIYVFILSEIFEGVTGTYDKLDVFTGLSDITRFIAISYMAGIAGVVIIKSYGLPLVFPKPWPNWFFTVTLPSSWFGFL